MQTTMTDNDPCSLLDSITNNEEQPFAAWRDILLQRGVFEGENKIEVFAGTNTPRGGNTEHGGQTVMILHDLSKTAVQAVRVITHGHAEEARPGGVVLVLGGDSEARTLADALEFAAQTIKRQIKDNHRGEG